MPASSRRTSRPRRRTRPHQSAVLLALKAAVLTATVAALAVPGPAAAQLSERLTLGGAAVAVHNLAGEIRVEPSTAADVEVIVNRAGPDADRLRVETMVHGGQEIVQIHYPDSRIVYPPLGRSSRSRWSSSNDPLNALVPRGSRNIEIAGSGSGVEAHADVTVRLPAGRRLTLHHGAGRVELRDLEGALDVNVRTASVDGTELRGPVRVSARSGSVRLERVVGDLDARARSGSIEVRGVEAGTLRLAARSGSVEAADLSFQQGELSARSGSVRLERARGGRLSVGTRSGRITADDVEAEELDLTTRSGGAEIRRLAAGTIRAESRSGAIELELTRQLASARVAARSGRVTLRVPASFAARLDLQSRGDIRVDAPVAAVERTRDTFRGRLGEGGPTLEVRTRSGGIRVVGG